MTKARIENGILPFLSSQWIQSFTLQLRYLIHGNIFYALNVWQDRFFYILKNIIPSWGKKYIHSSLCKWLGIFLYFCIYILCHIRCCIGIHGYYEWRICGRWFWQQYCKVFWTILILRFLHIQEIYMQICFVYNVTDAW